MRPNDTDALFRKAVERHKHGRLAEALSLYETIIRLDPNIAPAHYNHGTVLHAVNRTADALRSYDRAIALQPNYAEAHYNRGIALRNLKRLEDAVRSYDRVIALKPDFAEAHNNRGNTLRELKRTAEAIQSLDRAIRIRPDYAEAYYNKANVLHDLGHLNEALQSFDRAIELKPDYAGAFSNRGNTLQDLKRPQEALQSFDKAIAIKPSFADAHYNKGNALLELGRPDEALQCFDKAIQLDPQHAKAHCNKGHRLAELKRVDEAIRCYDAAIGIQPSMAEAHWNKSHCVLLKGDFAEGFQLYEWRKKRARPTGLWRCPQPEWTGKESLQGKTLLIHAEQGLGDTIQFCRYVLLAREKGAKVVFAVQDPLKRLLDRLGPDIEIVPLTGAPDAFDYHIALMSTPLAFGTTWSTCPAKVPYLYAEPQNVTKWRKRIGSQGFKIGICWQGNKQAEVEVGRSIPLRQFEAIARLPNVRLISLQKNDGVEQLADLPPGMKMETLGDDFDAGPDAFVDTAAAMECLDLVITSDTAVAHLAGALARPAWVALKYVPDWRWLLDRSDSAWYPTLRLFRQPKPDDWPGAFAAIETELPERIGRAERL